jgi:hypothetical protein
MFPKVEKVGFDETGVFFTMEVQLTAETSYEFSLNSREMGSFLSAEGVPLQTVMVRFRTAKPVTQ